MHKLITQHQSQGRVLRRIYVTPSWRAYTTNTRTPDKNHLANFKVQAKRDKDVLDLLVLDNYGIYDFEGEFPEALEDALFGQTTDITDRVLAVERTTGQCYVGNFGVEKSDLILILSPDFLNAPSEEASRLPKIPKSFLPKLDDLLGKKRPFGFKLGSRTLLTYIEHWSSLCDLAGDFRILLNMGRSSSEMLELWGDSYRIVSDWKTAVG